MYRKFKAASQTDLFSALEDSTQMHNFSVDTSLSLDREGKSLTEFGSSVKIHDILKSWTEASGFPIVIVEEPGEKNILRLSQVMKL